MKLAKIFQSSRYSFLDGSGETQNSDSEYEASDQFDYESKDSSTSTRNLHGVVTSVNLLRLN